MTAYCPKCASTVGRSVEAIYCECSSPSQSTTLRTVKLSRKAAPPARRHPPVWLALSAIFLTLGVNALRTDIASAIALAGCAVLSGWMARDALRYNAADLPRLVEYWHRSFMCTRCGEVFVPA